MDGGFAQVVLVLDRSFATRLLVGWVHIVYVSMDGDLFENIGTYDIAVGCATSIDEVDITHDTHTHTTIQPALNYELID
jgi:methylthioribose-1-phosphate isomerase